MGQQERGEDSAGVGRQRCPVALFRVLIVVFVLVSTLAFQNCDRPQIWMGSSESEESATSSADSMMQNSGTGSGRSKQVWFVPNRATSDYAELFSNPLIWQNARKRITHMAFYLGLLSPEIAGEDQRPNSLKSLVDVNAFRKLKEWGIQIAAEVNTFNCNEELNADWAMRGLANVRANGGEVAVITTDEPLFYLGHAGNIWEQCQGRRPLSVRAVAQWYAKYYKRIKAKYPQVRIGDIEPWPLLRAEPKGDDYQGVATIKEYIDRLIEAGVRLDHFHIDYSSWQARENPDWNRRWMGSLLEIKRHVESKGIRFGVIVSGCTERSFGPRSRCSGGVSEDQNYADYALWLTSEFKKYLKGDLGDVIFQSWLTAADGTLSVPRNLPEDTPGVYSHTRTISEAMKIVEGATTPIFGAREPTTFFRVEQSLYAVNEALSYCSFSTWESFLQISGVTSIEGIRNFSVIPSRFKSDGICTPYEAGAFRVGHALYFLNSQYMYCRYGTWEDFIRLTGQTSIDDVRSLPHIPPHFKYDGVCY